MWEYYEYSDHAKPTIDELQRLGRARWELVAVIHTIETEYTNCWYTYIFKRRPEGMQLT